MTGRGVTRAPCCGERGRSRVVPGRAHIRSRIGGNGGGVTFSDAAKITERLTRTSKDTINYSMRVEDSKNFTAPFTFGFPIKQEPGYQNFEYACHEGNNGMMNQLSAARAEERAAAEAAKQK